MNAKPLLVWTRRFGPLLWTRTARTILPLVVVGALFLIIPRSPLDGPIGGVIAFAAVLAGSWYGGPLPGLVMPLLVTVLMRAFPAGEPKPFVPTGQELFAVGMMTVLTTAVGLAGQFRRRYEAASRRHQTRMREQSRALGAARIVFCDLQGHVTGWTAGAERLFGWTADEAQGRFYPELLRLESNPSFDEFWNGLRREGQWQGEVRQKCRNGRDLIVSLHGILFHDDEGQPSGVALVHGDVTALRAAEAAAREADRRKDVFLATLAHELRNPLAPIQTGLDILALRLPGREEQDISDMMRRQLASLVRLINDLVDVSRINAGKIELRRSPVTVAEIAGDALETVRLQHAGSRHELLVQLPEEPISLNADRVRLSQVLVNLLGNAFKFTPAGGRITLTANRDGEQAVIRVRDSGIGMRRELLPRVFDMFVQPDNLQTRSHGGLGIGLSIVRTLVELHGGTVEAHSEGPGCGSEFIVRLPALSGTGARRDSSGGAAPANSPPSGKRRVLVVDDNQDAAATLVMLLKTTGCETRMAFDGPSALQMAEEFQPHAFVLDIGMPGMSGLELARRLRATLRFSRTLLIAVTGWGQETDREQSRAAGFDHHLVKPVDFDQLRELIFNGRPEHTIATASGDTYASPGR